MATSKVKSCYPVGLEAEVEGLSRLEPPKAEQTARQRLLEGGPKRCWQLLPQPCCKAKSPPGSSEKTWAHCKGSSGGERCCKPGSHFRWGLQLPSTVPLPLRALFRPLPAEEQDCPTNALK